MAANTYKREIYTYDMIGVVEETNDPKRLGRVKVRIERLHGRLDDTDNFIPTEDLPWCNTSVSGRVFGYPSKGKVVAVGFENDDYYNPTVTDVLHYDINLQEKLQSLDDEHYAGFYAHHFNDKHQYYHDIDEGIKFDYVKSNMNFRPNGDIRINLRDNKANLYLGTEDADQQAMLGNHWMDWFDELVQNLLGSKGGPYLGNMGAPVLPNPGMLEVLNKYLALRETFLSDRVFVVDDNLVKEQDRAYDIDQAGDSFNDEKFERVNTPKTEGYKPESRPVAGGNPENGGVKANNYSTNLTSSKLPTDATPEEKKRETKPFDDGVGNGKIPVENMTVNSFLRDSFPSENDERKYLLDEPSKALDSFLNSYNSEKSSDWGTMVVTKGYQNFERQENARKQYPSKAPVAGKDPFGFGNQVELYWGIDKSDKTVTDRINKYLRNGNKIDGTAERMPEEESLDWLVKNGAKYKWRLAGRTATGGQQWWHWIYDSTLTPLSTSNTPTTPPVDTSNNLFNPVEFDRINFGSGSIYSSGSTKTFNIDLNQSQGEWKIISLRYDYKADGDEGTDQAYDEGIKNNGKKATVNIEDFIENELDLTAGDFEFSNLDLRFKVVVDPIVNGKLDTSRKQVIKSDKFVIKVRK
jgi:hypothetical protein